MEKRTTFGVRFRSDAPYLRSSLPCPAERHRGGNQSYKNGGFLKFCENSQFVISAFVCLPASGGYPAAPPAARPPERTAAEYHRGPAT